MVYDFWDYVVGWAIVLAFLIPFGAGLLIQGAVSVASVILGFTGGESKPREKYLTVKVRSYDYDEDN